MFQLKHKVIIWSLLLVLCWALSPISAMALKCDKFYEGDYCPGDGKSFCCLNCPPGNQCQIETVCDPVPNGNNEVNCNTNQCVLTCNPGYQACGSECRLKAGGENCSDWNPCNNTCNACVRGYELSGGQCIEAILKLGRTSVFGDTIKQGDNNSLIFVNNSSVTIGSSTTAHLYVSGNSTIAQDLFMVHNKSIRIDSATDTTLFIGNYGDGQAFSYGTTPTASLVVEGDVKANQLCIQDSCRSSWPTGGGGLDGSGTSSYIAKWSNNNALTTSSIYDDGTNVGIGKTSPAAKLDVSGGINASETIAANRFKATNLVSCSKLLLADSAGTITCGPDPYVHPTGWGSQPDPALTASSVISQIIVNDTGHVTGVNTRGLTASNIGALASNDLLQAGSASIGAVKYNGTTSGAGYFDGGAAKPTNTGKILNFNGKFRASQLCIQDVCQSSWPSGTSHNEVTLANIGSTPSAKGASINSQVLTLQPASESFGGVVTTGEQTFAGVKTFNSNIIGTISTATKAIALASNGSNCDAGYYPLGVDQDGDAESCTSITSATDESIGDYLNNHFYTNGTGEANYIAKWSGAHTLTTSSIYDNGTKVGIGTTNVSEILIGTAFSKVGIGTTNVSGDAKLHINGGINFVNDSKFIISINGNGKFALYNNPGDYDFVIGAPFGAKEWLSVASSALKTSGKIDFNGTLDVANKKRMEISDTNNNILFYNKNGGQFMKLYMDNDTPTLQLSDASNTKGKLAVKGPIEFGGSLMVDNKTRISISTDTTGITFFKQDGLTEFFKVKTVGSGIKMSVGDGGSSSELDVGTVDPLYTIDGKRYATYMSGMTGVKEETSGVLTLDKNSAGLFMAKLDFAQSPEGSDLWLFGRTTDIINNQEHFNKVSCLLTSNFSGEVWYEKDWESKAITIFARPANSKREGVEVSYRLTAPRFDNDSWNNYSNSDNEGFNLDQLLQ